MPGNAQSQPGRVQPGKKGARVKVLHGGLTLSGGFTKLIPRGFAGALTSSGAFTYSRVFIRAFTAALGTAGSLGPATVGKALAAVLAPAAARSKAITTSFVSSLTPAGTLWHSGVLGVVTNGIVDFGGVLRRTITKSFASSLGTTGVLTKTPSTTQAGAVDFAGAATQNRVYVVALTATLDFVGTVVKTASKPFTAVLNVFGGPHIGAHVDLDGVLTFTGRLTKLVTHPFGGGVSFSSIVTQARGHGVTVGGVLDMAGTIGMQAQRRFGGSPIFSATVVKTPIKRLLASLTPLGTTTKEIATDFAGDLTPTARWRRTPILTFAAAVDFAGGLAKQIGRGLRALLNFVGSLTHIATITTPATPGQVTLTLSLAGSVTMNLRLNGSATMALSLVEPPPATSTIMLRLTSSAGMTVTTNSTATMQLYLVTVPTLIG